MPRSVYDGPAPLDIAAPRFDETPPDLVTGGIMTERGRHASDAISSLADELQHLREWG